MASTEPGFSASQPPPQAASSDAENRAVHELNSPTDASARGLADPELCVIVVARPEMFLAPQVCACCLAAAAQTLVVRSNTGDSVSVHYCEACLRHASAERTRTLSVCLASATLGMIVALGAPIIAPSLSPVGLCTVALGSASLPVLFALFWRRGVEPGHASAGAAVWWLKKHRLYCDSVRFARMAARKNGLSLTHAAAWFARMKSWYLVGPLATLAMISVSLVFNTATVRALNLTDSDYTLLVDGRVLGTVERTSAESPEAGREFRLGAGERHLTAISSTGDILFDRTVTLVGGAQHLYAPASPDTCFWLEFTSYGRQKPSGPPRLALPPEAGFWYLKDPIDTWFAPSPLPVEDDNRSSGGRLIALRQSPCSARPR